MPKLTLGVDIGTTGTKTVLADVADGRIVAQASSDSVLYAEGSGHAEADPGQWLSNVYRTIAAVVGEAGARAGDIGALATTGMVPAVVAVDAENRPLRRALLQNDARATAEIERLHAATDADAVLATTGSAITQQSVAPTAMWLRDHEPDTWARTRRLVGSYDWILMALGASPHVELNWAIESGLSDLRGAPFPDIFEVAGLSTELMAPVRNPGDVVGSLSREAAAETGLRQGLPLIVGGADHVLSAYAAGVRSTGDWLLKLGGAGDVLAATDTPVVDSRLYLDAHPIPGKWLPNGCMATSGSLVRWLQALTGGSELTALDDEAAARPPAEILCLPYFLGEKSPLHDPDLRGAFVGLGLTHTRADLYRAVLEAIAYGFKHHAQVFTEIGIPLTRALVTNGGSRSTLWKQILADVLDTELRPVIGHPGASLGAAVIAARGIGMLPDWNAIEQFHTLGDPIVPDKARAAVYSETWHQWLEVGELLTPVSHRLARKAQQ